MKVVYKNIEERSSFLHNLFLRSLTLSCTYFEKSPAYEFYFIDIILTNILNTIRAILEMKLYR